MSRNKEEGSCLSPKNSANIVFSQFDGEVAQQIMEANHSFPDAVSVMKVRGGKRTDVELTRRLAAAIGLKLET